MRPRTLLVLAGLVAVLLAFILLYERKLPSTDERRERAKRLFSFEADSITSLEIEWEGRKVRLERPGKKEGDAGAERPWQVVEPPLGRADSMSVDRVVGDLTRLEFERELVEVDRKDAGLDQPRGRVRWSGEVAGELRVGAELPASSQVLVEVEGRAGAFVIQRWLVTDLAKAPGDWRSREVLPVGRDKIARVALERPGGPRVLLVRAGERFRLEAPLADEADPDSADRLLTDLATLRISQFLDPPLAEAALKGMEAPLGRVEVGWEGAPEPLSIEVGGEVAGSSGERYHRAGTQAFTARSDFATALAKEPEAWRSRAWSSLESFEVERMSLSDGQGELSLERQGSDWKLGEKTVPYSKAGDLLYTIRSARAEKLSPLPEGSPPPASPGLTITLGATGGREEVLTLHERTGGLVKARRSGRAVELELPEKILAELEQQIAELRKELEAPKATSASQAAPAPAP